MPFSFKRSVTVQGAQVPGALTNFPMLFSGTYTYLRTVANGGSVQSASGFDIVFYADEGLTTKLDHEVDFWSASTGVIQAWIRIPSLAGGTDTTIWLAYGDNTITTSQENKTGVWNSNFRIVVHMGNGTTLNTNDSTSNANNLTAVGSTNPTAVSGKISGGVNLDRTQAQRLTRNAVATPSAYTVGGWILSSQAPGSALVTQPFGIGSDSFGFSWDHNNATFRAAFFHRNNTGAYFALSAGTLLASTYYYLVLTWDGTTVRGYTNGVQQSTQGVTSIQSFTGSSMGLCINNLWTGIFDEYRFSNVARSANWLLTEFRNQDSPSTFYAIGGQAPVGSGKIKKVTEKNITEIKAVGSASKINIKKIGGINKN